MNQAQLVITFQRDACFIYNAPKRVPLLHSRCVFDNTNAHRQNEKTERRNVHSYVIVAILKKEKSK